MRWVALAAASVALLLALAGCGSEPNPKITSGSLSIFTSLPMRGDRADQALAILRGEKLALQEVGGVAAGKRIGLVALDGSDAESGSWSPKQAADNARTAAENPTTIAYIGDLDSGATAVSLPVTNEAGILQVSPLSGYTGLTRPSNKGEPEKYYPSGVRTFARLAPNGIVEARALARWLRQLGIDKVAIAADDRQDGQGTTIDLSRTLAPSRVQVVADVRVGIHADDVSGPVKELEKIRPEAIVYAGASPEQASSLLRAAHAAMPGVRLFATSAAAAHGDFPRLLGRAGSAVRVMSPILPIDEDNPRARKVADLYRSAYGGDPPSAALYGYEAMRSVLQAIEDAGSRSNDRAAVIAEYFDGRRRESALGGYTIGRGAATRGDTSIRAYGGYRIVDGKLRLDRRLSGGAG